MSEHSSIICQQGDDNAPQPTVSISRVAGSKFRPGDGQRLYQVMRNTIIAEAEAYAKQHAIDKQDFGTLFAEQMDLYAREWLQPLLREAAGLQVMQQS